MRIAVLFHLTWMAALVMVGIMVAAIVVQTMDGIRPGLCGRACYAPGQQEDPLITLIGD